MNKIDDGNLGSSKDPNLTSNSNEIIEHFSTIDLRNKLSQGCTNNNIPIITQVTLGNYQQGQGQGQVRVEIYPPAQSCWREIRGFLHKEMNLRIKSSFYDALSNNEIHLAWTIVFQPPNLMTNLQQIETIVSLRKNQTKDMLKTLSLMSSEEANNCKERADALTQALKAYYQQSVASQYNLDEALDALVTLIDRSQKLVHAEQQKKFLELSQKPSLALYTGCPEQFMPDHIKNQRLQPFQPPWDRSLSRPTQGGKMTNPTNRRPKRPNQGSRGFSPGRGINRPRK